jgi:DNA-binding NarL/FixJ family response regulator
MPFVDPIRVLLADHHSMFVECLHRTLSDIYGIEVVGTANSSSSAVRLAQVSNPSVATVDASLPDTDGILAAAAIRRASPSTRVILLAETTDGRLASSAVEAGCSGFITKEKGVGELVSALQLAHAGKPYFGPDDLASILPRLDRSYRSIGSDLTRRELEVLQLMTDGGLGNREIATELRLSLNTVRRHVQSVLAKLNVHSKLEAVVVATREGLFEGAA